MDYATWLSAAATAALSGAATWGPRNAPEFSAPVELIRAGGGEAFPHQTDPTRPGTRTKVCVDDYNQDGLVDLLVGDFISEAGPPLELTPEQEQRRDEIESLMRKQSEMMSEQWAALQAVLKEHGPDSPAAAAAEEAWEKFIDGFNRERSHLYQEHAQLRPTATMHGFVWLYLRQP